MTDRQSLVPAREAYLLPTSFGQRRLWFLDRLEPSSNSAYIEHGALRLRGHLDTAALQRALDTVVDRHETLRTGFAVVDDEPVQAVSPQLRVPIEPVPVAAPPPADADLDRVRAELAEVVRDFVCRPFDLAVPPLFRAGLCRLHETDQVLIVAFHHAVYDQWSGGAFVGELLAAYDAQLAGTEPKLAELVVQYGDFAAWQHEQTGADTERAQLDYWSDQLAGLPPLELPTDRPRPSQQQYAGGTVELLLDAEVVAGLDRLARAHNATPFMAALAGFSAVLSRWSGQHDIAVGTPVAGRGAPELEPLIGFFVNNLVIRTDTSGDPSFDELLDRVRVRCLGAYAHSDVPFERVVERLRPDRDLARSPLFSVMFAFGNVPLPTLSATGLSGQLFRVDTHTAKFDLFVTCVPDGDRLRITVAYNQALFDEQSARRLLRHLDGRLRAAVAAPQRALSELSLCDEAERRQLAEWGSGPARDYPTASLPALVARWASSTPEHVAVRGASGQYDYARLVDRARGVSAALHAAGVRAGQLVGVAVERDIDLPVVLLGVHGCGASYLPLDPAMPADRLRFVLDDSGAATVLADAAARAVLPEATRVLEVERLLSGSAAPTEWVAEPADDDVAYVIYTSGSTGAPKGVAVPHRALRNVLHALADRPGLTAGDTLAAVTTLSFDIAAAELFVPLLVGGTLDVVDRAVAADGARLADRLAAAGATALQATPTTWRLLRAAGWQPPDDFGVWCGGEAFPPDLAADLADSGARVWNLYGPTEATVWATVHRVLAGDTDRVPLGGPLANVRLRVLDAAGQSAPVGVPGELLIGGAGLAVGYRGHAAGSDRFVEDAELGRAYRTGDVVCWRADGRLDYLGRADQQVKVRGYRIEPAEIEAVLRDHPQVAEAVVVARTVGSDRRLVGYVVPAGPVRPGDETLREACRQRLADYLVPSVFVLLPALPTTPNGKLDRAALPTPDPRRGRHGYLAPRTETETRIAAILADVLGVDRVGVHDDFFVLGGHSLLAASAAGRIGAELGVEVAVRTMFTHPTVAGLAAALPSAPASTAPAATLPVVERRPDADGLVRLPASSQQRRVWFLTQFDASAADAYVLHGALALHGEWDTDLLRRAVSLVIDRHEILRTGIVAVDGEPVQVVHPSVEAPVTVLDATDAADPQADAARQLRETVRGGFDLTTPPLLRVTLVRTGAHQALLGVVLHHAIADRIAVQVFTAELSAAYQGLLDGAPPDLPALDVQYADYAAAQQAALDGDRERAQLAYWRRQLADLPVLDLPTDRPRPARQTYRGDTRTTELPADLVDRLTDNAARHGATRFMALLTGYLLTLSRYSRGHDIAVGSPISGRTLPGTERLIGYFTNNLVLRADLSGDPCVGDLLARVADTCLDAFAHADVPFERLVEQLRPERDLAHSPLFDAMFIGTELPTPTLRLGTASATAVAEPTASAKYDLTVTVFPAGPDTSAQRVVAEYNTDLFDAATVDRMLAHYRLAVTGLAGPTETPVSRLPVLPDGERAWLTAHGTGPRRPVPALSLPRLLAPSFERFAERVAVSDADGAVTYAQLDADADRLAARLRSLGIARGDRVAVLAERTRRLPAGLLGVLRAGACYVPIDVDFPAERIALLLSDSAAAAVLTTDDHVDRLPTPLPAPLSDERVLRLDQPFPPADDEPAGTPSEEPGPDDLAYVIYTSGSTGRPKGVLLAHRPVVNFLTTMADRPGMGADDVVGAANTISCDMPVLDLYLPLLVGARIDMVPREVATDGERLAERLRTAGVSYLQGTPTTWRLLQEAGWRPPHGFTALAGAEKVPADLAHWLRGTGATVWHLYGPTETTVWSTVHPVAGTEDPLPLGAPVANTRLLVVDDDLRRVPVGVPGELLIGGAGLADGYWQRPELTGQRFVPDPEMAGRSVYRTGDVVRWRADGALEFLGRTDFQVKVRGYRIELGEIESVLRGHPAVRDAVLVVREDTPGDRRLVGYVDLVDPDGTDRADLPAQLHARCRQHLAEYMVPGALVVLDALPLTANRNKVDRAALPAPDGARPEVGAYLAPRTDTERTLAGIVAEVLGLDRVGVHDDFFALGGHSLLAARVVARVRAAFGVEVPVRDMFTHPTVAGLADRLPVETRSASDDAAPAAAPIPALYRMPQVGGELAGRFVLPASSGQRRLWFLDQLEPASAGAYTVDTAVRLTGPLDAAALQRAVDAVVVRHEALRTSFVDSDGEPVQVVAPSASVPVHVRDLPGADQDSLSAALDELSGRAFDLSQGPLLRVTLLRCSEADHVLHLSLHHAICDRWSVQVLARDLATAYRGAPLAAPAVQYGDYAAWQHTWLAGDQAGDQLAYWRKRLADLPVTELPTDRPRPAEPRYRGDLRWYPIDADTTGRIAASARRHGATVFMVGLAACQVVLSRYTGQHDVAVGSPVAGRSRPELEELVGFFVNNLVLRTDLSDDPTVGTVLARVRDTCLAAYAHAELPFDRVVEALRPDRRRAGTPLFSVLFAVQNTPAAGRGFGEASVTPADLRPGTAQFDLALMLIEQPDGAGLRLRVEFDTDLFDADTVDRIVAQYLLVLDEFTGDPGRRLSQLTPLSAADRHVLAAAADPVEPSVAEPSLPAAFAARAARTPDAVAVECGARSWSYAELDERARRMAARLRRHGVRAGDRVGLLVVPGPDLLTGILGTLYAGAAYVPMDVDWPAQRQEFVLADSGARVLLADDGHAGPDGFDGVTLGTDIDTDADIDGDSAVVADVGPDSLAYLIYTSGSTGRPKGVMVDHGDVLRLMAGVRQRMRLTADDVWSLFHSAAFDMSVFEMWGAWLTGARLVVVPYLIRRDPAELRRLLAESAVSVLSQTPTAMRQLVAADATADDRLDALRYVVLAGETLDVRHLRDWFDRYGDRTPQLINMYGTTETTVHVTYHHVTAAELAEPTRHRIGLPLPDLRIELCDRWGRPVPVGAVGEIRIAGARVARGYAGRPELTAERFDTDPHDGLRRYRSGDLARRLADGSLEFLGRADDQVKIRGFRVEPGEVEAVLRGHPAVADAVVVAGSGRDGDVELAGYVVATDSGTDLADVRDHARRALPAYLVPATLTTLPQIPRTANGKLDRRALPEPDRSGTERPYLAPRNDTERSLAEVWRQLLGVDRVGAHDDFFELGGHSLLATRAASQARAALGADVRVRDLFDHPTVAGLAAVVTTRTAPVAEHIPSLARQGEVSHLPASSGQRRLWLLAQLDPDSAGAYVVGTAARLTGALDVSALRAALADVVDRHEPLRTCLVDRDGDPVQRVYARRSVPVEVVDLPDADESTMTEQIRRRLTAPFDLAEAPLLRLALLRRSDTEQVLVLAMHHAIGDQRSTQVLVRDLVAGYRERVAGRTPHRPAPAVQYADVAAWQRDRLSAGGYDADLDYWAGRLAGLPVLDLPTDHPRPPVQGYRGAQRVVQVPPAVVAGLTAAAHARGATPFMAALAAYQLLLARYARQRDFGVAVPVSGRDHEGLDELIGFFAGTVVLRADLSGTPSVAELIDRVRHSMLDGMAHAEVAFEAVVERLGLPRDLSRTPLAQAGFALVDRVAEADRELSGVRADPLQIDPGTAKTDLTVTVLPTDDGGWRLVAEYRTDLLRADTVDRMLRHLAMLVEEFAADTARRLTELPTLPAEESRQLERWAHGLSRPLPAVTWPDLFEEQVAATPRRVALRHAGRDVTYAQLNDRANRLARRLHERAVAADCLVAVVAERSVEMVVAVLAVLKAGGAYVPIDPTYPPDRVSFMLTDSAASVVLTQAHLVDALPACEAEVLVLADDADEAPPVANPPRRCGPRDLAYVIYTSGSAGTPKGVCVEHRSVVNLSLTRYLADLREGSRVLQFAPFSFDVSVFEMVLALLGGLTLVVPTKQEMAGGAELVELINRERVTFTFVPPSLLAHLTPDQVPELEVLGSGGEDCPAPVAERWGGHKRFLIGYGPTEATVYATVTDEIVGGGHPPIGRPVVNGVARILDADLQPRPIGTPGELYLGGPGLARGYLRRRQLTAESFVTSRDTGERLYRTGDVVRYLPDGTLEFLGRVDDQVKLRGFRIELGEVAAALRGAAGVSEAVAVVRTDPPDQQRLVGYLVVEPGTDPDAVCRQARTEAERRLPAYMVPTAMLVLPSLPVGPSGKVDRRALPAPASTARRDGYVAPRTDTERRLTRMVAEALRVERVGVDDDFFDLGGHSLLAARLHTTIRRVWNVDLPIRALFENPRIGDLAALLDRQGSVDTAAAEAEHVTQLRNDVALPAELRQAGPVRWSERPRQVLLTGATGFLGAFLAERLVADGVTVLCLVRGVDDADAQRRLEDQLRAYGRWHDEWRPRIRAVAGDLALPRFGLSEEAFTDLGRGIDEIYHAGAVVHFQRPYAMLRDGNVGGTVEILRLATVDRPVPVHHISTLSVFAGLAGTAGPDTVLREDELPDVPPPAGDTGYSHSKWVAEQVVALARSAGLPVAVYRPGRIGGDARTGAWRADDLVCRVIRACAVTGLVPDAGLATDLVPVDHLAAAITLLARHRESLGRTFHFALRRKVELVAIADALGSRGYRVRRADAREWYAAVAAAVEAGAAELGPVLTMYAALGDENGARYGEPAFDTSNTRTVLGDRLAPATVDSTVLGRYVDGLRRAGALPDPDESATAEED